MDQRPVPTLSMALETGSWSRDVSLPAGVDVEVGQRVGAGTPLGRAPSRGTLLAVDVAGPLGIAPSHVTDVLRVTAGQQVASGTVLAEGRRSLRRRSILAPCNGVLQGTVAGCVLLRQTNVERSEFASLDALVSAVSATGDVTLQFTGTRLWGAWGCGEEIRGPLVMATSEADEELRWQHVGRHLRGAVLVGGWLRDGRAVQRAQQFGLAGLLVGGVDVALARRTQWPLPILATEGFGPLPMAATSFAALAPLAGYTLLLHPQCDEGRPYAAVAHVVTNRQPRPTMATAGAHVHLLRAPYLGQVGQVADLPTVARQTALGTREEGALVALPNGQRVFVPWANLELAH
ncbi:MAG: hypothetical protein ABFD20_03800 [Anaerolineales bacterium]